MKGIKQINNYRLTRLIGKGATAKVYEAVNEKNKNVVAVKEIDASKLNDARIMENFKRELRLLSKFKNKNIIKILDLQKTKHNIYLILEFCNGGNLFEYKIWYEKNKKCELNELLIQKILRQLIIGLEYMHQNNSIHRDIKLENILLNFTKFPNKVQNDDFPKKVTYNEVSLNDPFEIKIADLGYARELEGTGIASTMCGTPITMAPDVALQKPNEVKHTYNNKADLWSLGTITYELLIGRPPFYANNYKDLFNEINDGKYTLPRKMKLSTEVLSFINGLLQFYPEKRMDWKQIKEHPFIKNDVQSFNFLDLETIDAKGDKKNLELNAKNCDNFLWINFKNDKLNMNIDKVNNENMKDPKIKKIIDENKTKNEEILKAIEEEKKKIEEEKKKIEEEKKKQAEKIKKENENIKKEKEKNEKMKKLNEEKEKKIKEQTNLNQIKENEINKKLEELKNKEKLIEQEKQNNLKLIEDFKKKEKELENKSNSLDQKNQKLKEEENKKIKELEIKENNNKLQQEKLKNEIDKLKSEKEELKNQIDKKNKIEEELKKKEEENSKLQNKLNEITIEKENKILEIKQKNEEQILSLKEQKLKDDLLADNLKINNENNNNINENNNNNNNKNEDLDDWEDLDCVETQSVKLDYEINEDNNGFEIIEEYMDNNEFKN